MDIINFIKKVNCNILFVSSAQVQTNKMKKGWLNIPNTIHQDGITVGKQIKINEIIHRIKRHIFSTFKVYFGTFFGR